jgi:hypothetical protein
LAGTINGHENGRDARIGHGENPAVNREKWPNLKCPALLQKDKPGAWPGLSLVRP